MDFLRLNQVAYTYPGKKKKAVAGVSLGFALGEKVAVTGNNGSGKSTLAKLMVKMLAPQDGSILLEGKNLAAYTLGEIGRKIGFLLQNPVQMLFCPTVYQEIAFSLKWNGVNREEYRIRAEEHLRYFELWSLKDRHPFTLSGGEQQLLALAAITVQKPRCLILDEPTNGLDSYRLFRLEKYLQDLWHRETGLIIISHNTGFLARFGGRRIVMENGGVASDET